MKFADAPITIYRRNEDGNKTIQDCKLGTHHANWSDIYMVHLGSEALFYYMSSKLFGAGWPKPEANYHTDPNSILEDHRNLKLESWILMGDFASMFIAVLGCGHDALLGSTQ